MSATRSLGGHHVARVPCTIDTSGSGRYDVTPLFADARAFAALVDDLLALTQPLSFEIVAGIDALGFILGSALALRAGQASSLFAKRASFLSPQITLGS